MASAEQPVLRGTPEAELEIDAALVRRLLEAQHPDLVHLPVRLIDSGWDNAMFRLGEQLCVRLPRRILAAKLLENEQTWLSQLALQLPLPVPAPIRQGHPTLDYPWRWSIVPWLPGVTADQQELQADQVKPWSAFLQALHQPAPDHAPQNPVRGVPLRQRASVVAAAMQQLESKTDLITPELQTLWHQALAAPIDLPTTWLHGDLHPRNILVHQGVITGVIDWGDITAGDRATDLASIWMLFSDPESRQQAIAEYRGLSEATILRAKGWAILFGVLLLQTGLVDHPQHAQIGARTLRWVADQS